MSTNVLSAISKTVIYTWVGNSGGLWCSAITSIRRFLLCCWTAFTYTWFPSGAATCERGILKFRGVSSENGCRSHLLAAQRQFPPGHHHHHAHMQTHSMVSVVSNFRPATSGIILCINISEDNSTVALFSSKRWGTKICTNVVNVIIFFPIVTI